jgi:hypothetical protein
MGTCGGRCNNCDFVSELCRARLVTARSAPRAQAKLMLGNLFLKRSPLSLATGLDLGAAKKLQAALAELPPAWQALRNRRSRGIDGPPWVKFIVCHPEKGIALIDFLPADPTSAIEPLDEFLARTGFEAFSQGDPPIVGLALREDEIDEIGELLIDAFAAAPRCGIKNSNWTEAAIELLMSTPGLLLTRITKPSDPPPRDGRMAGDRQRAVSDQSASSLLGSAANEPAALPAELKPATAPVATQESGRPRAVAVPGPDPSDGLPEYAKPRGIWAVPTAVAASLVLGAIGLVYSDWPEAAPPITKAEVERVAQPVKELPALAAGAAIAAPEPAAVTPPPQRKRQRVITFASRPVWEEARRADRKAGKAPAIATAERKERGHEDFFTALNNWLSR